MGRAGTSTIATTTGKPIAERPATFWQGLTLMGGLTSTDASTKGKPIAERIKKPSKLGNIAHLNAIKRGLWCQNNPINMNHDATLNLALFFLAWVFRGAF
ncbi:MAG: hypothetical protein ACOYMG_07975 [Candidatus Methylumidiphilus sp.]